MKNILLILVFSIFSFGAIKAQLVINEIMYNSPDGGVDSIEYIELLNAGSSDLNLMGYNFTQGVTFTFPNITMASGTFLVLTRDSLAMLNTFGVTAYQWTAGALNNTGEDIEIRDAVGNVVDFVEYSESLPWPAAADGEGSSLELCDAGVDNSNAANWKAGTIPTGILIDGVQMLCTPGIANSATCPAADHFIEVSDFTFTPADITIFVGETVQWENNTSSAHNINGSLATYPVNPEGFSSGATSAGPWTYSYTFNTIGVYDYQSDGGVAQNMFGKVLVIPQAPNDIVITEILYNQPGIGNGHEFVEIHNQGSSSINLNDYTFSQGIDFVFPDVDIAAGAYLVIAENAANISDNFGVTAFEWSGGGLNDDGEDITLLDDNGNLVDMVIFSDVDPWPEIGDGEGPSIIVCDPTVDNSNASNWGFSTTNTGVITGNSGNLIYATPGAANDACVSNPHIFFNNALDDKNEGTPTFFIELLMANTGNMDTADVQVFVDPSSTATDGFDFTLLSNTISFGPSGIGGVSVGIIEVFLLDDVEVEPAETIVLNLFNPTNGAVIGSSGNITITIIDNDGIDPVNYPLYEIKDVTTVDQNGIPDSTNVQCELRGIVYGVNLLPGGLEFFIIDKVDEEDGILVFSFNDFDYNVSEGDEISAIGTIGQFNGLSQISADSVVLISQNNTLFEPDVVNSLNESTESKLVRINNLTVVSSQNTGTSGTNYTVTDGVNEYLMRIDADVDLFGQSLPPLFDAIGIGSQFDGDIPYTEDYRFLPRYIPDIIAITNTNDPELGTAIAVYPNPTMDKLNVESKEQLDQILIHNILGQQVFSKIQPDLQELINVEQFASGLYMITVVSNTAIWTSEFVKK